MRARILRIMIAWLSPVNTAKIVASSGENRKKISETSWKCPKGFRVTGIHNDNFYMELLEAKENPQHLAILQLHGGGYVGTMTNAHRSTAVLYSKIAKGASVLTIDYRVAPKYKYPAALEDALHSYEWLLAHGYKEEEIIVAGDSAGAGLGLALCMYLRDHKKKLPKGILKWILCLEKIEIIWFLIRPTLGSMIRRNLIFLQVLGILLDFRQC